MRLSYPPGIREVCDEIEKVASERMWNTLFNQLKAISGPRLPKVVLVDVIEYLGGSLYGGHIKRCEESLCSREEGEKQHETREERII